MKHLVALSGGKDSCAMAIRLHELNPDIDYEYFCTPTGNELPEMNEHWEKLECLLGKKIKRVHHKKYKTLIDLINEWNALPNWRQRWCTRVMKIEPVTDYYIDSRPCRVYVGLRGDEEVRQGNTTDFSEYEIEQVYPMRDWGWGIHDVWSYLQEKNITIPRRTDCAWCFYQRLSEWWLLWRDHPEIYQEAVDLEDRVGHTFRSENKDNWPGALKNLRKEFESGRQPRGLNKILIDESQMNLFIQNAGQCGFCSR